MTLTLHQLVSLVSKYGPNAKVVVDAPGGWETDQIEITLGRFSVSAGWPWLGEFIPDELCTDAEKSVLAEVLYLKASEPKVGNA